MEIRLLPHPHQRPGVNRGEGGQEFREGDPIPAASNQIVDTPAGKKFSYTEEQWEAINSASSKIALLGAASTGKTSTIVARVVRLMQEGVDPNSILVLTYGRARANNLRDEILLAAGVDLFEPLVRTFHSLSFSIINENINSDDPGYVLLSGAEQEAAIKELLMGVDEVGSPTSRVNWPQSLQAAIKSSGFVRELRDLISRATELDLTPSQLNNLGKEMGEEWWTPVSEFFAEYRAINNLRYGSVGEEKMRIDPSAVIGEAVLTLNTLPLIKKRFSDRYTTIMVDDFQESDLSQRRLLTALEPQNLFIVADPDSATGRFRGADPEGSLDFLGEFDEIILKQRVGIHPDIVSLDEAIVSKFRGNSPTRSFTQGDEITNADVISFGHLGSESDSAHFIAQEFKSAHLMNSIPWSEMVVLLRSPSSLSALIRAFEYHDIPISLDHSALPLADNPAITPLLSLARLAISPHLVSVENWSAIEEILRSDYCGADSISLRGMKVALAALVSQSESEVDAKPSTNQLAIQLIRDESPEFDLQEISDHRFFPLTQFSQLWIAARQCAQRGEDIYQILWSIWSNARDERGRNLATLWRDYAIDGGARGAKADRDLDAIMYLFQSAIRYINRLPGSTPISFIEHIEKQSINSDAIVAQGQRGEIVEILTVHSTEGRHWSLVGMLGLQEGEWPNLRARSSLLGSERLMESHRVGLTKRQEIEAAQAAALVEDERRLLHVAITRASQRLIIAAYSSESGHPSTFADEIVEKLFSCEIDELPLTELKRAITEPAIVADLRRALDGKSIGYQEESVNKESIIDEGNRLLIMKLLNTLAAVGIESANPDTWLGVKEISTTQPILQPEDEVWLSPSALDSFTKCGLRWFLEKSGGRNGDSTSQLVGTSLHALAADLFVNPERTLDDLAEILKRNWSLISSNSGWVSEFEFKQATQRLKNFMEWHQWATQSEGRSLVAVERSIKLPLGRAILNGTVDRIERDKDGNLIIIDLKSGGKWSSEEIEGSLQLRAYQLAAHENAWVEENGLEKPMGEVAGASFVFLKTEYTKPQTYETAQEPLDEEGREKLRGELIEISEAMSGSEFTAQSNKYCKMCDLQSSCPLYSKGRWVIE